MLLGQGRKFVLMARRGCFLGHWQEDWSVRRLGGKKRRDGKHPLSGRSRQSTGGTNRSNDGFILLSVLVTSVIDCACTKPKPWHQVTLKECSHHY